MRSHDTQKSPGQTADDDSRLSSPSSSLPYESLPREALIAQLRILREALPHAIYTFDLRTQSIDYLNGHAGKDLGYTREELGAMGPMPLALIHPDDIRRLPELYARWSDPDAPEVLEAEMRMRARDGSWRWFLSRDAVLERDADGNVVRLIGTTNDITERKLLERQNLSVLRLDAMGHVAGHLAHEYNNLLAALHAQLALARDHVREPDQIHPVLEDALNTVEKAADLTRRLLGFAHQQVARNERINLEDLLKEAEPLLQSLFQMKRISFEFQPTPVILANRTHLLELLVQLVNSVSAGATSVVIRCGTSSAPERDNHGRPTRPDDGWALLRIAEYLADHAPTAPSDGHPPTPLLGYGLEVARQLVADVGAHFEVAELDVRCCKLDIRFPPASRDQRAPPEDLPVFRDIESTTDAAVRVLVVEDDEVLLELTRRILARAGFETRTASSGEAALAIWEKEGAHIRLVVTDVVMPGMSGLELASRLTREHPDLPVLFVSGFLKDDLKRDARLFQRQGIAFCDKPFRPEELVATSRSLLLQAGVQPPAPPSRST